MLQEAFRYVPRVLVGASRRFIHRGGRFGHLMPPLLGRGHVACQGGIAREVGAVQRRDLQALGSLAPGGFPAAVVDFSPLTSRVLA
jgi:hypothetical protein